MGESNALAGLNTQENVEKLSNWKKEWDQKWLDNEVPPSCLLKMALHAESLEIVGYAAFTLEMQRNANAKSHLTSVDDLLQTDKVVVVDRATQQPHVAISSSGGAVPIVYNDISATTSPHSIYDNGLPPHATVGGVS